MARLACPCGFQHDLDAQPDSGWLTLPDKEYELLESEIVRCHTETRSGEAQVEWGRMYLCPSCGRLMWHPGGDGRYRVFVPEPS
jgi:hypothetical protein